MDTDRNEPGDQATPTEARRLGLLARISSRFLEAGLDEVSGAIDESIAQIGAELGADTAGLWHLDIDTRMAYCRHRWVRDSLRGSVAETEVEVSINPDSMSAEEVIVAPFKHFLDESSYRPSWADHHVLVVVLRRKAAGIESIVMTTSQGQWSDECVVLTRGYAGLVRQLVRRSDAERDLSHRLELEDHLADMGGELIAAGLDDIEEVVGRVLVETCALVGGVAAVLLALHGPKSLSIDGLVVSGSPTPLRRGQREVRFVDPLVLGVDDIRHLAHEPQLFDLDKVMGMIDVAAGVPDLPAVDSDLAVMVVPAGSDGDEPAVLGVVAPTDRAWSDDEVDTLSAVATLLRQTRFRLAGERRLRRRRTLDEFSAGVAEELLGARADRADEILDTALAHIAEFFGAAGAALRELGDSTAVVERAWAPPGRPCPAPGTVTPVQASAQLRDLEAGRPIVSLPDDDEIRRTQIELWGATGAVVSVPLAPGESTRTTLCVLWGQDQVPDDAELDSLRSLALMLGQFRARVTAERRDAARLADNNALRALSEVLAAASSEEADETIVAALGLVGAHLDADRVIRWRVDQRSNRLIPEHQWSTDPDDAAVACEALPNSTVTQASRRVEPVHTAGDPAVAAELSVPVGPAGDVVIDVWGAPGRIWGDEEIQFVDAAGRAVRQARERMAAQRYVTSAFDAAPIGVVMRDGALRLLTCNQAFLDFIGAPSVDDLVGTVPNDLYDDDVVDEIWNSEETTFSAQAAFRRRTGGRVWGQIRVTTVADAVGGEKLYLSHIEDITERRRAEQLLRFQATHDELTGLANRRRLSAEIRGAVENVGSVAVLLLDLDQFKIVNDSLGHHRGDELLVVVADRLRLAVRPGDVVARLGGDEFAVLLPGPVDAAEAAVVAERLLRLIGGPVELATTTFYPTASIGIAVAGRSVSVEDVIGQADAAMYRAKALGRNRYETFDDVLRAEVMARIETEAGLRRALRSEELTVHYQPEIDLLTGRILAAEALVRWEHPDKGLLAAGSFVPVAEETGLVVEMGRHVLVTACREAVDWTPQGDGHAPVVRVNLAAAQIQRDETVDLVRTTLLETGLPPTRLCLEITESAMMHDVARAEDVLRQLKALGVELAVDDFGTGFSSLAYLKRFPVDALKIDRAFVNDLGTDPDDTAFVRSIVSLAEALGLGVVAEGVETEAQAAALIELGCHRAQGYLYGRPGPPADLRARLSSSR